MPGREAVRVRRRSIRALTLPRHNDMRERLSLENRLARRLGGSWPLGREPTTMVPSGQGPRARMCEASTMQWARDTATSAS